MQQINRSLRLLFSFALALSIGFPIGVLGIIFGAVWGIIPLLVGGILLTVGGFYAMPLLWVKYGERRQDRALLRVILEDRLFTVDALCAQTGYAPADVRAKIKKMILSRELVGFLFEDDVLKPLEEVDDEERRVGTTKKCPCCGATMESDGRRFFCEYCRHSEVSK